MSQSTFDEDYKKFEELLKQRDEKGIFELLKNIAKEYQQFLMQEPKFITVASEYKCYIVELHYGKGEVFIFIICPQRVQMIISEETHRNKRRANRRNEP